MDEQSIWVFLVAIAAIAVPVWVIGCQAEKQRRKRLGAVASRLGFEFTPEYQPQLLGRLAHFHLFSQGYSKGAWNVMDGRAGDVRVQLFDHQCVKDSGKPTHNSRHTVLLFESARLQLPAFSLRPKGIWDGVAGLFGQQGIEFEASPEFSSAYLLQGRDEDRVRAIFPELVVAYCTRHPGLYVEGEGELLIYCHNEQCVDPAEIPDFFQEGLDVLDLWIQKEGVATNLELIGLDLGDHTIPEVRNERYNRL